MKRRHYLAAVLAALSAGALAQVPAAPAAAAAAKPVQPAVCTTCHKPEPANVAGYFDNVAFKSQSIQMNLGTATEIVRFDPKAIEVIDAGDKKPAEHLREIRKGHEMRVEFIERDGQKWARVINFKGPIKTPAAKLVNYDTVARLVAQGPDVGQYTLIDSRPPVRFAEGTIPSAINLPYPAWDKFVDRLPKDKNRLTIFFCQGVTCMMSPMSLRKAEALGYTNVRVYREGVPEWMTKDYLVTAPAFVKSTYIDKGIPLVLLDVRRKDEAASGHLISAVGIPLAELPSAAKQFPDPKFKAPIVVLMAAAGPMRSPLRACWSRPARATCR
jgi:rhodanese-related sulfurtransferase